MSEISDKALKLIVRLKKADDAYFNTDSPIMSDAAYDRKREKLAQYRGQMVKEKKLDKEDKKTLRSISRYLNGTGAVPKGPGKDVPVGVPMPSVVKVKNDDPRGFSRWLKPFHGKAKWLVQSPKLDGTSIQLKYKNGNLVGATTRGDGEIGKDVNHHACTLAQVEAVPGTVRSKHLREGTYYIRGELMISEVVFSKKWRNKEIDGRKLQESRNAVNGWVNSKEMGLKFARDLVFFAYEVRDASGRDIDDKEAVLNILHQSGFTTYTTSPQFKMFKLSAGDEKLFKAACKHLTELNSKDEAFPFMCDGLVLEINEAEHRGRITTDHPSHARGFKVSKDDLTNQEVHVTTCTKVEWRTSKNGAAKPLVHYKPVMFGSTKNTKANGVNAANIKRLGIAPGTKLKVVRSGGVIPQIIESVKGTQQKDVLPKKCECGSKLVLVGKDLFCSTPLTCKFQEFKRLEFAVKFMEIDGLAGTRLKQVYDSGVKTVADLRSLSVKKLLKLPRWGDKLAKQVTSSIQKAMDGLEPYEWLVLSGVFVKPGYALGGTRIEGIVNLLGEKKVFKPLDLKDAEKRIRDEPGLGGVAATCFVENHKYFLKFMKTIKA